MNNVYKQKQVAKSASIRYSESGVLYTYDLFEEFEKIFRQYLEQKKTIGN